MTQPDTVTSNRHAFGADLQAEDSFPAPQWYPQQASWIREPHTSDNAAYNYPLPMRMRGPLNRQALRRSLEEIVRRHPALRSVFRIENEQVTQVVLPPSHVSVLEMDLRVLGATAAESKALQLAVEDAQRPFDLSTEPLLRATLLQLGADDHVLLLTTHHIVCDDWSTGILLRDLSLLYSAYCAENPSPLPPVSYSYGEFARQLARQIQVGGMQSRFQFWRQRLAGGGDFHHLAPDYPRPARQTYRGAHEVSVYSEELLKGIKALAQREQVSPFMVLVAAFQCLVQRYSGQDDIGIASCVANRNSIEVEELIGPFSNRVVMRTDLSGNPTFRDVLHRCRNVALDAYSNQDVPFGELVERIAVPNPDRNSLFQVLMILQNAPRERWQFPRLTVNWFAFDVGTTRYDLNVWLQFKNGLEVDLQYNTDLFEASSMRRILEDYRTILEAAVTDTDTPVPELSVERNPNLVVADRSRSNLESELVKLWEDVFGKRPIGVDDNFFNLGGDSMLAVRLLMRVRQKLEKELSIGMLFQAPTVRQLAVLIQNHPQAPALAEIVPIQPKGSRIPFFCIRAGPKFMPLAERLDPYQPFLGVELRPEVIPQLSIPYRLEEFARHLADVIVRYQPTGPYFIGGFCASGLAALEVARLLAKRGEKVALLALFNAENPMLHDELARKVEQLGWLAQRANWNRTKQHLATIRKLSAKDAWGYALTRLNGLRQDFQSIVWQTGIDIRLRLNGGRLNDINQILYTAIKAYKPQPYSGNVVHFVCARRRSDRHSDPCGGWRDLMNGHFEAHEVPGGYWDILKTPSVDVLAEQFRECLTQAYVAAETKGNAVRAERVSDENRARVRLESSQSIQLPLAADPQPS